jgi:hypothetical protein
MKILITDVNAFTVESADGPETGRYYFLEDATEGTQAQNKTAHALIQEYWRSGLHPKYGGDPFDTFRDQLKRTLGEGFAEYIYATIEDGKPFIHQVKKYEDIPLEIREDEDMKQMIRGRLKSWTQYTNKQRRKFIDALIDEMFAVGVSSKKFDEILQGMDYESTK